MNKSIAFVLPSPIPGSGGWGNGYVALPEGHPFFGVSEDYDAPVSLPFEHTNGQLTFARLIDDTDDPDNPYAPYNGMWVIGFDTLHSWDSPEQWPDEESVMKEALLLKEECDDRGVQLKFLEDNAAYYEKIAKSYRDKMAKLIIEWP